MISTSGASSVYRSIRPPTAEDRQGANPPAVSSATFRTVMARFSFARYVLGLDSGVGARVAIGPACGITLAVLTVAPTAAQPGRSDREHQAPADQGPEGGAHPDSG